MEEKACGELGLNIDYFYSLTPVEFNNILTGFERKEREAFKNSWQQVQQVVFYSAFNFESKNKNLSPQKFYPLPWEVLKTKLESPRKTRKEIKEMWDKIDEKSAQ